MAHKTLSDTFVGTDVEAAQLVKSEIVFETSIKSQSNDAKTDFWNRINKAVEAASAKIAAEIAAKAKTPKVTGQRGGFNPAVAIYRDEQMSLAQAARKAAAEFATATSSQTYVARIDAGKTGNARTYIQADINNGRIPRGVINF